MPSHRIHRYVSKLLLGDAFSEVHVAIDAPYRILGRKHRRLFHSPKEAFVVGYLSSTRPGAGLAGLLHSRLDQQCSKNRKFKKWVEWMERENKLWEKQMRVWKKMMIRSRRSIHGRGS